MQTDLGRMICGLCGAAVTYGCVHACFEGDVGAQDVSTMPLYGNSVPAPSGVSGVFTIQIADSQGVIYDTLNPDAFQFHTTVALVISEKPRDPSS